MSIVLPAITALGTAWYVELFDDITTEKTNEMYRLVSLFLSDFEATYSRFKPNSTLSKLNQTGRLENPDTATIELLELGQKFYRDTNGIFNMLVGKHLIARGYDANYSFKPTLEPVDFPSPLTDLIITDTTIILQKGHLDLGGYGKGFLIDRLANYLTSLGFSFFLINGGGDIYATSDHNEAVLIYLEHPSVTGTYIGTTTLKDQGFAASSTHKRRWKVGDKEYSHIVDTGKPVNHESLQNSTPTPQAQADNLGIYTKAKTAVVADVWATTLLISDPREHHTTLLTDSIDFARFDTTQNHLTKSPNF